MRRMKLIFVLSFATATFVLDNAASVSIEQQFSPPSLLIRYMKRDLKGIEKGLREVEASLNRIEKSFEQGGVPISPPRPVGKVPGDAGAEASLLNDDGQGKAQGAGSTDDGKLCACSTDRVRRGKKLVILTLNRPLQS